MRGSHAGEQQKKQQAIRRGKRVIREASGGGRDDNRRAEGTQEGEAEQDPCCDAEGGRQASGRNRLTELAPVSPTEQGSRCLARASGSRRRVAIGTGNLFLPLALADGAYPGGMPTMSLSTGRCNQYFVEQAEFCKQLPGFHNIRIIHL